MNVKTTWRTVCEEAAPRASDEASAPAPVAHGGRLGQRRIFCSGVSDGSDGFDKDWGVGLTGYAQHKDGRRRRDDTDGDDLGGRRRSDDADGDGDMEDGSFA